MKLKIKEKSTLRMLSKQQQNKRKSSMCIKKSKKRLLIHSQLLLVLILALNGASCTTKQQGPQRTPPVESMQDCDCIEETEIVDGKVPPQSALQASISNLQCHSTCESWRQDLIIFINN